MLCQRQTAVNCDFVKLLINQMHCDIITYNPVSCRQRIAVPLSLCLRAQESLLREERIAMRILRAGTLHLYIHFNNLRIEIMRDGQMKYLPFVSSTFPRTTSSGQPVLKHTASQLIATHSTWLVASPGLVSTAISILATKKC